MIRPVIIGLALVSLLAVLPAPARADGAEAPARLRTWHVGIQGASTWRDRFDVFGVADLPPGEVARRGAGGGLQVGRRFGDRFLLGLQMVAGRHDVTDADSDLQLIAFEALITGTVLFRERELLQPFLRGGFGAGGVGAELPAGAGDVISFGTAAVAGGGCLVRLGGRVHLELEAVATFTNHLEVQNDSDDPRWTEDSWQVRVSHQGWRVGVGLLFGF